MTAPSSFEFLEQLSTDRNIGVLIVNSEQEHQAGAYIRSAGFGLITLRGNVADVPDETVIALLAIGKMGDDRGELKGFLRKARRELNLASVLLKNAGGDLTVLTEGHEEPWKETDGLVTTINSFCSSIWGKACLFGHYECSPSWFMLLADSVRSKQVTS